MFALPLQGTPSSVLAELFPSGGKIISLGRACQVRLALLSLVCHQVISHYVIRGGRLLTARRFLSFSFEERSDDPIKRFRLIIFSLIFSWDF